MPCSSKKAMGKYSKRLSKLPKGPSKAKSGAALTRMLTSQKGGKDKLKK